MFNVSNRDAWQRLIQFLINALAGEIDRRRSGLYQIKYSCLSSPDKRGAFDRLMQHSTRSTKP
jgi:hypothetical protein